MTTVAPSVCAGRPGTVRCARAAHGRRHAPLLLGRELQDVVHQEFCVVLIIALERRWSRTRKDPMIVLPPEKAGWHRGAWADRLRIQHPLLHPIGLQASAGL